MQRRDVLRATALGLGTAAGVRFGASRLEGSLARPAAAHPGPYSPFGSVALRGTKEAVVAKDGHTVYVALSDGFGVIDVEDPANPTVVSEHRDLFPDRTGGPLEAIYDVKTDGDRLAVVGPAHGFSGDDEHLLGAAIYDVADPQSPELVGLHETDYPIHNCDVSDGVAYLTGNLGEETAMVAVDVAGDTPEELGRWRLVDENAAWSEVHTFVRTIHDITVHDDVAYVAHWDAGTWLVDVSDPADMTAITAVDPGDPQELQDADIRAAGYELPGNSHYCAVNDDATVLGVGEEAWDLESTDVDGGPGGITLYDISDTSDVTRLARIEAPETGDPGLGGLWTTSHNFDFHGDRLYTSWYRGGVKLFDVAVPDDPVELAWWRQPDEAAFWTAQYAPGPGCYIGASRRNPPAEDPEGAALYTFPDHPGTQADPPSLTATNSTTANGDGGTGGTTQTTTPGSTTTSEPTTTSTTATDTPGFGIATGLAALGTAGYTWLRRRGRGD